MTVSPQLLAILVCPKCKGELEYKESESALLCHTCRLKYAIRDGSGVGVGAPQFGPRRGVFVGVTKAF